MQHSDLGVVLTKLTGMINKLVNRLDAVLEKQNEIHDRDSVKTKAQAALGSDDIETAFTILNEYQKGAKKAEKLYKQEAEYRAELRFLQDLVTESTSGNLTKEDVDQRLADREAPTKEAGVTEGGGNSETEIFDSEQSQTA